MTTSKGGVRGQSFEFHPIEPPEPWQLLRTQNVIGLLEGAARPEEIIVVGS